jgi:ketosteroid isomerase-like protein
MTTGLQDDELVHLRRVIAKDQIREVIGRYARGIDRLDWDLVRACYHPDAIDDHGVFRGGVDGFVEYFSEGMRDFEQTMHLMVHTLIELAEDIESAVAETYCIAYHRGPGRSGSRDVILGLRYLDRFARRGGVWRIADRTVVLDWSRNDPVERRWRSEVHFSTGTRGRADPSYLLFRP